MKNTIIEHTIIGRNLHYKNKDGEWEYKTCPFSPVTSNNGLRNCMLGCALFTVQTDDFLKCEIAFLGCRDVFYILTDITKKD